MQRCPPEHADLILDTWGWRLTQLAEAETLRHKLAGYKGASWPHWAATLRRLQASQAAATLSAPSPGQTVRHDTTEQGWPTPPCGWGDQPPLPA